MTLTRAQQDLLRKIADGKSVDRDHGWQMKTIDALLRRGLIDEKCRLTVAGRQEIGLE